MKKLISKTLMIAFVVFISGCAATYKPINPESLNYTSNDVKEGIGLSYRHNMLQERGNKKYSKKEYKKGVKLIAVKLTNYTDSTINVGNDLLFYSGKNQVFPMEPMVIKKSIKQIVPLYLLYLLLTPLNLTITSGNSTTTYPIGLAIGPGITIGNMAFAGTANKKMLKELNEYNILDKDIKKGETVYGIIGVGNMGYDPISVKLRGK